MHRRPTGRAECIPGSLQPGPPGKLRAAARALYERGPSAEQLAAIGLTLADLPEEEVEVWPDAWAAVRVFEALGTQWRLGQGGPSGLDYTAIPSVASMLGIRRRELTEIFPDLRIMEHEALAVMAEAAD
ncbi:DUF1799 domain-containing protein [Pseudomonas soli]|uniref:DUF1799 domain-containing protein n=1 Tax=Pseudomonas soli TaxID=1306993 RepID=UPI0036F27974